MAAIQAPHSPIAKSREIFMYFGPLTLLIYIVSPHAYLLDIASAYMLKNQLHATASQISTFRVLTAFPIYVSFAFGLARDLWNPFGIRDRGFFILFAPATAAIFIVLAMMRLTYAGLFVGTLLAMVLFRFVAAAYQGLMALTAQEKLMSGRLSALWQTLVMVGSFIAGVTGGYVAGHMSYTQTFLLIAALTLLIGLFGLWKPRSVFRGVYDPPVARGANFFGDIKRLVGHVAIYPPVLIMLLFQFSPGLNTPMQFYLTNTLHASDAVYGEFNGIVSISFIPAFFLYGFLCKKFSLKTLLWVGSIVTVPQMVPLALVHSGTQALVFAVPMGLLGGIAVGAFCDLTMRSCPNGLQGSLMMLVDGIGLFSLRASDSVGSAIYDANPHNGFLYCVIVTTAVYALILPILFLIPAKVISTAEGQPNPESEVDRLAGIPAANPVSG